MHKMVYLLSAILSASVGAAEIQMVDIGFRNFDKHIAIELTILSGESTLVFRLSSNTTGKWVPIGKCVYTQSSLLL